ncbi:thioesterase domain-containing protein [Sphingobacterium sp. ML3W]|uniref:thioesterase II family protein n=1 Tax=Sphingobacterium sp. ML3W TaxID=1538644 RepID=UPI00249CD1CE|nr:alpha/beta fold hydrolase [Sphingobacterium sp. ML3W]WFA78755.1 thioesterase domain-containing protein [Sphingobacterium sp. ML3W]
MLKPKIFFLHFAGGNKYSYNFIKPFLLNFEICVLELPGRGDRIHEPLLNNFEEAANDLLRQILYQLSGEHFIIFGHSMGAALAFYITYKLEKLGKKPLFIIESGNPGPGVVVRENYSSLGDDAFCDVLKKMGGIPEAFFYELDLMNFYLPILRSDFQIVDETQFLVNFKVASPIIAMMGEEEEYANSIANWSKHTYSEFKEFVLKGGHFFIYMHPEAISRIINLNYGKYSVFSN